MRSSRHFHWIFLTIRIRFFVGKLFITSHWFYVLTALLPLISTICGIVRVTKFHVSMSICMHMRVCVCESRKFLWIDWITHINIDAIPIENSCLRLIRRNVSKAKKKMVKVRIEQDVARTKGLELIWMI